MAASLVTTLAGAAVYLALGRVILGHGGRLREPAFAILNMAAVYLLFFPLEEQVFVAVFAAYVMLALVQLWILRNYAGNPLAPALPVIALVALKLFAGLAPADLELSGYMIAPMLGGLVGISYFAFRTSQLAVEVRNGRAPMPTTWQYLAFAFFLPTMWVGPISRYAGFEHGLQQPEASRAPASQAWLRILVGATKYRVLAGVFEQLAYAGLLLDGHPHHWMDLGVAAFAYYLYLYCNFSGFCDIAIGAAAILGIPVDENFDSPFAARNLREFWNRWHITLSTYMRDVVFTPVSKTLTRMFGPTSANHAAAVSIVAVFLLIGLWHGFAWNYLAFGAMHALGVVTTHYYTLFLRRLGRERFAAYNANPWIRSGAMAVTFVYVSASFFLFANTFADQATILSMLRR